jgi:hypothetical protein
MKTYTVTSNGQKLICYGVSDLKSTILYLLGKGETVTAREDKKKV